MNILIVDDEELIREVIKEYCEVENYHVFEASDGIYALDIVKNNMIDLIILDIQLPKLTGFELLEKLNKENFKIPPVIITSACAMDCDKQKAKEFGIEDYITKPIDINNFIKTVKQKIVF